MAKLELFSLIEKYGIKADKNTKPEKVEKNSLEHEIEDCELSRSRIFIINKGG